MKRGLIGLLGAAFVIVFFAGAALAADIAVVDTVKIFNDSTPAKAAGEHLKKVQEILQNGLNELEKTYAGKEDQQTRDELIRAQATLQQQLGLQQQAIMVSLTELLGQAVEKWRDSNKSVLAVFPKQNLIDSDANLDVTTLVMTEMNKLNIALPDLPKVTVTPPEETKPAKSAKPAAKKAVKQPAPKTEKQR